MNVMNRSITQVVCFDWFVIELTVIRAADIFGAK